MTQFATGVDLRFDVGGARAGTLGQAGAGRGSFGFNPLRGGARVGTDRRGTARHRGAQVSIPSKAGQGLGHRIYRQRPEIWSRFNPLKGGARVGTLVPTIQCLADWFAFQSPQRRGKGWDPVRRDRQSACPEVSIPSKAGQGLGRNPSPSRSRRADPSGVSIPSKAGQGLGLLGPKIASGAIRRGFNPLKGGARVGTR